MERSVTLSRRGFVAGTCAALALPRAARAATADAATLFASGDWTGAVAAYEAAVRAQPDDPAALAGLARLRYAANRLDDARELASRALARDPNVQFANTVVQGATDRAALRAAPIEGPPQTIVRFAAVDPLPLVPVRIGKRAATFFVDTGAGDPTIDAALAQSLGLAVQNAGTGVFAGGRTAQIGKTRVAEFSVGDAVMRNVAFDVSPGMRERNAEIFGRQVDGVLGTRTLLRFLSTIDYAGGRLVLRRRTDVPSDDGVPVPFWWFGDHFLFARGSINDVPPELLLVDTGLAGGGFMPARPTVAAAHLDVGGPSGTGTGGGGAVRVVPVTAARIALGDVVRRNVGGLYTPDGDFFGIFPFSVGGLISHGFFRTGTLTFDVARMRLLVT